MNDSRIPRTGKETLRNRVPDLVFPQGWSTTEGLTGCTEHRKPGELVTLSSQGPNSHLRPLAELQREGIPEWSTSTSRHQQHATHMTPGPATKVSETPRPRHHRDNRGPEMTQVKSPRGRTQSIETGTRNETFAGGDPA